MKDGSVRTAALCITLFGNHEVGIYYEAVIHFGMKGISQQRYVKLMMAEAAPAKEGIDEEAACESCPRL
jgi:hypothetical protein